MAARTRVVSAAMDKAGRLAKCAAEERAPRRKATMYALRPDRLWPAVAVVAAAHAALLAAEDEHTRCVRERGEARARLADPGRVSVDLEKASAAVEVAEAKMLEAGGAVVAAMAEHERIEREVAEEVAGEIRARFEDGLVQVREGAEQLLGLRALYVAALQTISAAIVARQTLGEELHEVLRLVEPTAARLPAGDEVETLLAHARLESPERWLVGGWPPKRALEEAFKGARVADVPRPMLPGVLHGPASVPAIRVRLNPAIFYNRKKVLDLGRYRFVEEWTVIHPSLADLNSLIGNPDIEVELAEPAAELTPSRRTPTKWPEDRPAGSFRDGLAKAY